MFAFYKNMPDDERQRFCFWAIACLALCIETIFHMVLPVSVSNDTYGYLSLSQHLGNPWTSFERSIGYPLFITILGINLFDSLVPTLLAQAVFSVAVPLLTFKALSRWGLKYAIFGAVLACTYLYHFIVSLYILTEPAYVFALALYAMLLVRYFKQRTISALLWVIAGCWLIALIRVSGTLHFMALLAGIGVALIECLLRRNKEERKKWLQHGIIAALVYFTISLVYGLITDRTAAITAPHFVFNWVYRDSSEDGVTFPAQYGIIKPENGPAAKRLFQEIEATITQHPDMFAQLKSGGSEAVQKLTPQADGKYSKQAIDMLMDDIIHNNRHLVRSWWIEGALMHHSKSVVATSHLLRGAIIEAIKKHPEIIENRLGAIYIGFKVFFTKGVPGNNVILPTAYYPQIPADVNTQPADTLRSGVYKQWTKDLFNYTGSDPKDWNDFGAFPSTWDEFKRAITTDNMVGAGHAVVIFGMQIIRACWVLIAIGFVIFPFSRNRALLASLLSASAVPTIAAVFMSEVDMRHALMSSPIQIVTAVVVLATLVDGINRITRKDTGKRDAR